MRLSTKSHLAVSVMVDVALHEHFGPVTIAPLAKRHRVTPAHVESVIGQLRRNGLVDGLRGPKGGYVLARTSKNINVADIVIAVDDLASADAARLVKVTEKDGSIAGDLWDALTATVMKQLRSISLQTLVQQEVAKGITITVTDRVTPTRRARGFKPDVQATPNSVFAHAQALSAKE